MKIKIVSDGTPGHTHVINVETGEELENVKQVYWWAVGGEHEAEAIMILFGVPAEVVGEAEYPDIVAAYEEWKQNPSTARPYADFRAERKLERSE